MLYLIAATHKVQGDYLNNNFKQIGYRGGLSDSALTVIGSFGALFNGSGKVIYGISLDYIKFKPLYSGILVSMITSMVLIHFSVYSVFAYGACIWVCFMGDGSMTAMLPVATINIFGLRRGP